MISCATVKYRLFSGLEFPPSAGAAANAVPLTVMSLTGSFDLIVVMAFPENKKEN